MRLLLIRGGSSVLQDVSVTPTDQVAAPLGTTILDGNHYDSLVEAIGNEEDLHLSLGVVNTDYMTMPIDKLKTFWKKRVQKQAERSFADKWSIFEVCLGVRAGSGKPAYDNMMADAVLWKANLKTAKDAITEATTNDEIIAISFVVP